ncbi:MULTISPECIES: hypothetical protein [Clostridium]|nr:MULTISPECIES: hypothetical protein [Clostridium]
MSHKKSNNSATSSAAQNVDTSSCGCTSGKDNKKNKKSAVNNQWS